MERRRGIGKRLLELTAVLTALAVLPALGMPEAEAPGWSVSAGLVPVASAAMARPHPQADRAQMPEAPIPDTPDTAPAAEAAAQGPEVPEAEPVDDSYFADAVFLGDSRTEGFSLYSGLEEGECLYAVGATVWSVAEEAVWKTESGKVPLLDALETMEAGKVYIMLGANELGWPRAEVFREQYGKVIDRIREDHPDAEVVIQSILPVSAKQQAKGSYVNNGRISEFNELLRELAEEKGCPYLDVAEAVTGADGCLEADLTFDGIHLNVEGCKRWLEYLRTHPV